MTEKTTKWCMLAPSAAAIPCGDRKDLNGACCHHRLQKNFAVTEKTRKWGKRSPSAAEGHCSDRKDQEVVYAIT